MKKKSLKNRNVWAASVRSPLFKKRVVKNKKKEAVRRWARRKTTY